MRTTRNHSSCSHDEAGRTGVWRTKRVAIAAACVTTLVGGLAVGTADAYTPANCASQSSYLDVNESKWWITATPPAGCGIKASIICQNAAHTFQEPFWHHGSLKTSVGSANSNYSRITCSGDLPEAASWGHQEGTGW